MATVPSAISAQGTLIARQANGSGTFVTIAELRNITPPPLTRKAIETTSHNVVEESFVVGIRRKGEMTFDLGFVPTLPTHDHLTGLINSWVNGYRDVWKITFPDGFKWLFSGYVTNVGSAAPIDDGLSASVSVRPTNVMTFQSP